VSADEEIAKELIKEGKALVRPIYEDLAQPAVREIGLALGGVVRVALAPVSAMVWGYDRIAAWLPDKLSEKLRDVPPDRIGTPPVEVAGPTLEALRFAGANPELRELYANLLATSMDLSTVRNAHPAFVEILKQLSTDEARIIRLFATEKIYPVISLSAAHPEEEGQKEIEPNFSLLGEMANAAHNELTSSYLDNLDRLGLIELSDRRLVDKELYKPLINHPHIKATQDEGSKLGFNTTITSRSVHLTQLGALFIRACVLDKSGAP
jgi:hypothetical protein